MKWSDLIHDLIYVWKSDVSSNHATHYSTILVAASVYNCKYSCEITQDFEMLYAYYYY